jgi:hypothetical protein
MKSRRGCSGPSYWMYCEQSHYTECRESSSKMSESSEMRTRWKRLGRAGAASYGSEGSIGFDRDGLAWLQSSKRESAVRGRESRLKRSVVSLFFVVDLR